MENKVLLTEHYESDLVRQSQIFYHEDEEGNWCWICPKYFNEDQKKEWYRILNLLSNVEGMDLRNIVCGIGLKDHCLGSTDYKYLDMPVTEEPVTEEPVTEEPVTEEPVTEEP